MSNGNLRRFLNDSSCKLALSTGDINYLNKKYTINGSPTLVDSPFGKSMSFDGTNDYISLSPILEYGASFSISFWAKPSTAASYDEIFADIRDGSAKGSVFIYSSQWSMRERNADGSSIFSLNTPISINTWQHVTFTYSGTTVRGYLDGVLDGTNTNYDGIKALYQIGFGATGFFNGQIDQVLIFDRALSAQEVSDLYHGTTFNYMDNGSLVGYWKLDDLNTVKDLVGSNDGTVNGNPTLDNNFVGGKCLSFDGTEDYVQIENSENGGSNEINLDDDFTLNFWAKATEAKSSYVLGNYKKDEAGGPDGHWINLDCNSSGSGVAYRLSIDDAANPTLSEGNEVALNEWHLITGVRDKGDSVKIYVDGVLQNSESDGTTGSVLSVNAWRIGNSADDDVEDEYYAGLIDEVMIFNKSLTEAQIKDLYFRTKVNLL